MRVSTRCVGLLLSCAVSSITCPAQTQAQFACEKAALTSYEACLKSGIPCNPAEPNCGPHKGSPAQCLPAYQRSYNLCQPSFSWSAVGGPSVTAAWPPAREQAAYWTDAQGNFWLFGGFGLDVAAGVIGGAAFPINDFWKYTPTGSLRTVGTWKSMGGTNVPPVANTAAMPGGRAGSAFAVDAKGNVWIFGGVGYGPNTYGALNDLWQYRPGAGGAPGTWKMVWSSGANVVNNAGNYGTQNVAAATNAPGGRWNSVAWFDSNGNLMLFGGFAVGSLGGPAWFLNDLWRFSPSSGMWTWLDGQMAAGRNYVVTTPGMPGGRAGASYWGDGKGNVWIFGGEGFDSNGALGALNDLWTFNSGTAQWSMVNGSLTAAGATGNYGQQANPAASNVPPGRSQAAMWKDSQGNFWLFGGTNADTWSANSPPPLLQNMFNDTWEYKTASSTWIWIAGPQGTGSTAAPGARVGAAAWPEFFPSAWILGGYGIDSPQLYPMYLYDMWSGTGTVY